MRYHNAKTGAVVDSRSTLSGAWVPEEKWTETKDTAVAAEKAAAAAEETVTTGRKRTKKKSTEA